MGSLWQKRGAIIAHPYGPLGGCYDDPVVQSVVTEVLKHGFIVGTFNFRSDKNTSLTWAPANSSVGVLVLRKVGLAGMPSQSY